MSENINLDIDSVNKIVKKIVGEMGSSKEQIFQIIENVRIELENIKQELAQVKIDIGVVIAEVDLLSKQDKIMRKKLAEVSKNFSQSNEMEIKAAYEKASDIRIKYITKQNEEKTLSVRRTQLEMNLKKAIENLENGNKIMNHISIALSFIEGDILSILEGADKSSEMFVGIKILEAQENERKRIARDIHDGPAQQMANVIMKADICSKIIQKDLEEGLKELSDLKKSVSLTLKEVRNIIFDLRPMSLDDLGLNQTINEIVRVIKEESGIDITVTLKHINTEIEPIIQVAVYRIIQEVLNNIKKHSKAKHVEVKLDYGTKYLMLIITDDGVGFNVEETLKRVKTKGASYGLISIFDRVNQLQGKIEIVSSKGVTYKVRLPISREVIKDGKSSD